MDRRSFLALLGSAPLAALAPLPKFLAVACYGCGTLSGVRHVLHDDDDREYRMCVTCAHGAWPLFGCECEDCSRPRRFVFNVKDGSSHWSYETHIVRQQG